MKKLIKTSFVFLLFVLHLPVYAQDDLLDLIDDQEEETQVVQSTFKGTRIITGHSVETRGAGTLDVIFMHRFGRLNSGIYEWWGLDQAWVRLGAEYSITNDFTVGLGRSSYEKTFDGFLKYQFLKQREGVKPFPFTGTAFVSMAINTLKPVDPDQDVKFSSRISYTYQVLMARKFSDKFSLQFTPTLVHQNLVQTPDDPNDIIAIGLGGRQKISKRMAVLIEYFYQFNNNADGNYNPFGIGFEIETGGHVFQMIFANSQAMIEKQYIAETSGNFFDGDIHFGFNITRAFQFIKSAPPKEW